MRALGFMTGTSLDAVDMAVLETDGETISQFGPAAESELSPATRAIVEQAIAAARAWPRGAPAPEVFEAAALAIADEHLLAAQRFLEAAGAAAGHIDVVGVHGQTVLHEAPRAGLPARTAQLIDAKRVAEGLGLDIAFDFRAADVAAGGQGAPLAPVYHQALARGARMEGPVAILNLGGVANVTLIGEGGELEAFDTGPANGMIDHFVQARSSTRCDVNGVLARSGRVHDGIVASYLDQTYFKLRGPKSLDRFDFSLDPVAELTLEDGAATLTAFAAQSVVLGLAACSQSPRRVIVCGGGRHNPAFMLAIRKLTEVPISAAEGVGWRGDSMEAEAIAYLAVRTFTGLPITFPGTTGVAEPLPGGRIIRA